MSESEQENIQGIVDTAITSRRSIRRFLSTPISEQIVRDILRVASRAPSGTNVQPWRVHVVTGTTKQQLITALLAAHDAGEPAPEQQYYPAPYPEPFLSRRRKIGWDLYAALGIVKGDHARTHAQHGRNYRFFDAPVGFIFTISRALKIGSWLDYGMFLQNICIAARGRGLDTCPQVALANYPQVVREQLRLDNDEMIVCGMALGYADTSAPENNFRVEREAVESFTIFHR